MRIYIASDHAGFDLKKILVDYLKSEGKEVEDCGAYSLDPDDDYPDLIIPCAQKVAADPDSLGIIIGGSGQGEAFAANKVKGIRAVVYYGPVVSSDAVDVTGRTSDDPLEMLRLTREHNDANILSLSKRFLTIDQAKEAVDRWLSAEFDKTSRHQRRHDKIKKFENEQA